VAILSQNALAFWDKNSDNIAKNKAFLFVMILILAQRKIKCKE